MSTVLRAATFVLLAALMAGTFSGCKKPADAKAKDSTPAKSDKKSADVKTARTFLTPVVAERVQRGDVVATIPTTGSIVPLRSRLLRVEEAGRLKFAREWKEGEAVKKGELIALIDSESLTGDTARGQADVALQTETLVIGERSMKAAVKEFNTMQDLYSRGITALKEVDSVQLSMERAINTHRQNQINLAKAETSLKTVMDRAERIRIVAPFDGLIVARATLDGTKPFATAFGSEIITDYDDRLVSAEFLVCGVVDSSEVLIRCDVTSKDVGAVRPGQEAEATIYAQKDIAVSGKVVSISRSVNADSRAFQVDVQVVNKDGLLKPGMFGKVDLITERRRDAVSISKDLLLRRNNKDVVFVIETSAETTYPVAREVPVEIGLEGRDSVEITFGLKQGDGLITRGFEVLQDKSPVSVIYSDAPTTK